MDAKELKKILAGLGVATLVGAVGITVPASSHAGSGWGGKKEGAVSTESAKMPAGSGWGGKKDGAVSTEEEKKAAEAGSAAKKEEGEEVKKAEARHAALEEVEAELAGAQARKTKRDADRAAKALQRMAGLPGATALVSDSGTDHMSDGGVSRIRVAAAHSRAAVSPPAQRPTSAAPPSNSPSRRNTESTATPQTPPIRRTTPTTTTPATTPPDTKKKGSGGPADFRIKEAQTAVGQAQMQDIWT